MRIARLLFAFPLLAACGDPSVGPADAASDAALDAGTGGEDASAADAGVDADASDAGSDAGADGGDGPPLGVLVFSRTEGFRHGSIADGVAALEELAADRGWRVTHTEDPAVFVASLSDADVTVWLNTTGDVLSDAQQADFEEFARAGGGWVGVHSATDTEYDWAWYGEHAGTWFARHPRIQDAVVEVERTDHPSTAHLDAIWMRRDEWYDFRDNPRERVEVLMTVRESSYEGGMMGDDHPIAWHHEHDGGRAFYTAMGHTRASYAEPAFRRHLAGGIEWAAGLD